MVVDQDVNICYALTQLEINPVIVSAMEVVQGAVWMPVLEVQIGKIGFAVSI